MLRPSSGRAIIQNMVKGRQLTPAEKRRLLSKIRAERAAVADLDALILELNESGVSVQTLMKASGEKGEATHIPHSTFHTRVQRARKERDGL